MNLNQNNYLNEHYLAMLFGYASFLLMMVERKNGNFVIGLNVEIMN